MSHKTENLGKKKAKVSDLLNRPKQYPNRIIFSSGVDFEVQLHPVWKKDLNTF